MKVRFLVVFCSVLMVVGCTSTSSTNTNTPAVTAPSDDAKKDSLYEGISAAKVKKCMGTPAGTFSANNNDYLRYFTPSRCEVLFVIDHKSQKVLKTTYIFPHGFTRYGYPVQEKKCPLAQKECLLSL
ncbi:MAG: hypothetical protein K0R48_1177 [Gammaproteobacteria bacterium]|jgi:outer membrane protein assembly factor BamE (lipoprotein component of BamABCDE complex)|nr:hypothetical protein [Gammaproteobacteria bacterium]